MTTAKTTLSRDARQAMGTYVARQRELNEVRPAENSVWERPVYRAGDGDTTRYVPRPGSLDTTKIASRGLGT